MTQTDNIGGNLDWGGPARPAFSPIRRFLSNTLSRRLLRAAYKQAAPFRMGLGALVGLTWLALGGAAAVDFMRVGLSAPVVETAAPRSDPGFRLVKTVADGVCVFRAGKPCDYSKSGDIRIFISQTALALLAVLTLVFGFWTQLLASAAQALRAVGRGHVVITGAGAEAETLARNAGRTRAVVLVRRDASSSEVDSLAADGVAVVAGPPTDAAVLRAAGVADADRIVAISASDAQNVGVAAAARSVRRRTAPGDVLVRVESAELRRFLPAHGKLRAADMFSLSETSARLVTSSADLMEEALCRGQDRMHAAMIGWGELNIAVIARLLRLMWAPAFAPPRVTVFAVDAAACEAEFRARFPAAFSEALWTADIAFKEYEWRAHRDPWAPLRAIEAERGPFTAVFVSLPADADTLHGAAALASHAPRDGAPLYVRENSDGAVGVSLATSDGVRVLPFGAPQEVLSSRALIDRALDRAAQSLHAAYIQTCVLDQNAADYAQALREGRRGMLKHKLDTPEDADVRTLEHAYADRFGAAALAQLRGALAENLLRSGRFTPRADRPAQRPWEALAEQHISASRTGADHALIKLWSLGWRPAHADERGEAPLVQPHEIDARACEMEHFRWAVDLLMSGWRYGPRNEMEMTHPDLRPYADFPAADLPAAIDKDRDPWLAAPSVGAIMHPGLFVRR